MSVLGSRVETTMRVGSCVDHQASRAPEGLLFQQLHCLACGAAAFRQHFLTRKQLVCVEEFPISRPAEPLVGLALQAEWREAGMGRAGCW